MFIAYAVHLRIKGVSWLNKLNSLFNQETPFIRVGVCMFQVYATNITATCRSTYVY